MARRTKRALHCTAQPSPRRQAQPSPDFLTHSTICRLHCTALFWFSPHAGLLENVRVRRAGYAHRSTFERFLKRYGMLSKTIWSGRGRGSARDFCVQLVGDLGWTANKEYALGKSKIFIQEATTLFALEDALDRRMDDAIATIQKAWRAFKNKLYFTRVRHEAYTLVQGRKERRRASVSTRYQGDYIHAASNKLLHGLLTMGGGAREKIIFADRVNHQILKGKRSVLGAVFGKKQTLLDEPRLVLLTDRALYSCAIGFDATTGQSRLDLYFRVPILQISHVVTSPFCDSWVVIHFAAGAGSGASAGGAAMPTDVLWRVRHKTELFALLAQESKKQGRAMFDLRFQASDTVVANAAKKRTVEVSWTKDDMLDSCTDKLERVAHNVAIRVASGIAPNQVPVPPKPSEADASLPGGGGRPAVKAMFDCAGNAAQGELAFKTGDVLFIVKDEEGGWFECTNAAGQRGFVPGTYVERVKKAAARPGASSSGPKTTPKPLFNFTASSGPPPPVNVGAKKSPWEELKSDTGETYYYNSVTQQSQWDKPAEMNAPPPAPAVASSGVMSPVSSSISQGCAFGGCGKPRFGGKPYCAQHAMGGAGANPAASGPPAVPGRFGAGAAATPTPVPAARPAFGGGASSTPVPAPRPVVGGGGATPAPAPAARPVARFGGGGAASATPSNTAPGPARPAINTGAVAANRANLFANGAVPIFGAPRPMGTGNPNAAGMYSAPAAAAAAAPVAMARPPAFAVPPPAKKKSDWVAVLDESSGNTYYFNEKTNESSWDKPADL